MNPPIQRTTILPRFIGLALACFAVSQGAQGVVPPPPGGYPNFTTAAGDHAVQALTLGLGNTAIGTFSLFSVTAGNFNTAVGAGSLDLNTADSNTATGAAALLFNTTGTENTANGTAALEFNDTGIDNTADGAFALFSNTTGNGNTASGWHVLQNNTGDDNTAMGGSALQVNTTGSNNTALGVDTLLGNTTGNDNTALGVLAGFNLTTGDNNIDIGSNVMGVAGESNTIRIGNNDITDTFIRGINGATASGGAAVFVNGNGKLGTMTSSARFKDDIRPMDKASEAILALRPVSFRYKKEIDPQSIPQFGLIAEEVAKVNPALVLPDKEGKPYTVRYDQVNAMLLNEFLKEHSKNEEQEKTISALKSGMTALAATLREQAAQIQKVSAQLELSKSAPKTVLNNQ
jgi:hypothetical protein